MRKHLGIRIFSIFAALTAGMTAAARAAEVTVTIREVTNEGIGQEIGHVQLEDNTYGLLVRPDLRGLSPGPHGMHVHENPNCGPVKHDDKVIPAGAAGGHYDPQHTGRAEGPYGEGALGDLPNLIAEPDGSVTIPTLAPRLQVRDIRGRALVIHAGADRYRAEPASHHHGMAHARRIACGVIE